MHPKTVRDGLEELSKKDIDAIQVETAWKWAGRACAAKMMGLDEDAHEYAHEALEHAALAEDEDLLPAVRQLMARYGARGN